METVESEPQVLANRRGVAFAIPCQNSTTECVITIATLEAHFWLESRASDARILKTFRDGYGRIRAIAGRKLSPDGSKTAIGSRCDPQQRVVHGRSTSTRAAVRPDRSTIAS